MLRWGWYYLRLDRPVRSILRADPPTEFRGIPKRRLPL